VDQILELAVRVGLATLLMLRFTQEALEDQVAEKMVAVVMETLANQ
jgi:hypothetical protein